MMVLESPGHLRHSHVSQNRYCAGTTTDVRSVVPPATAPRHMRHNNVRLQDSPCCIFRR